MGVLKSAALVALVALFLAACTVPPMSKVIYHYYRCETVPPCPQSSSVVSSVRLLHFQFERRRSDPLLRFAMLMC